MRLQFRTSYLITFLLFGLSLVVLPFGRSFFEIPKVVVAELAIQVLFLSLLFRHPGQLYAHIKSSKTRFLLVLLGLILISQFIHPLKLTLFGNVFRLQGAFLWVHLIFLSLFSTLINLEKLASWLPIATLSTLLVSAFIFGKNAVNRFYGLSGDPNALGAMAVFCFPWIFQSKNLGVKLIGLGLAAGLIFLSGSRSALIAWLIEIFLLGSVIFLKIGLKKAFLGAVILMFASLSLPFLEEQVFYQNYNGSSVYKFESRAQVWLVAFNAGFTNPFVGWGFGNTQTALQETAKGLNNTLQYVVVDSAHNILLDFWVQGGLVAVGVLGYLIYLSIRNLLQQSKLMYLSIFLGLIICLLFNPVSVVTLVQFWWLMGTSLALSPTKR